MTAAESDDVQLVIPQGVPAGQPMSATAGVGAASAPSLDSLPTAAGDLHLVSWNVAGWKTTVEHIRRFKGGLASFLHRHHVDVLCLQEVKLSAKAIAADSAKLGAETPGFESFWACNEGGGAQRQGLNGVATFARTGTVLRADCEPLRDAELDREGRCILTDHGEFVLFNVYVPNSAGGPRLPFKIRFLEALRAAMARERGKGKAVILAGDLNMKTRAFDSHWTFRPIDLHALPQQHAALRTAELPSSSPSASTPSSSSSSAPTAAAVPTAAAPSSSSSLGAPAPASAPAKVALSAEGHAAAESIACAWPRILGALRRKEVRPFETKNSRNGQTFQRWGCFAEAASGEMVRIGPPVESEEWARSCYQVDGAGVESDGSIVFGPAAAAAALQLSTPGRLSMGDVAECMRRLAGAELPPKALREIAAAFGRPALAPAVAEWLGGLLRPGTGAGGGGGGADGGSWMVDSFAALRPDAEERFTCWDQYKNRRHENVGGRIDYILVDQAFFERHARRGAELPSFGARSPPDAPEAALASATLGGLSQPAAFAGGGMPALEEDEYLAQFNSGRGTGMLYTPPQLSDHIPVTLLLQGLPARPVASPAPRRDAATQKCQPHRSAKRITDFFARKSSAPALDVGAPPAKRMALGSA